MLFGGGSATNPGQLPQRMKIAEYQVEAHNSMGLQVYNVSSDDFAAGRDFLATLQSKARYSFVSANLADSASGKLLFEPYQIVVHNHKKFAVIGVTAPVSSHVRGVRTLNAVEALGGYLPTLRREADYVIVLAAVNNETEDAIARLTPNVDFLLRSDTFRFSRNLEQSSGTFIARCGNLGKYLGLISFTIENKNRPLQNRSSIRTQLEYTYSRLESFLKPAGDQDPDVYYENRPDMRKIIMTMKNQAAQLEQELKAVVNPLDFELIPLAPEIADDPDVRRRLDALSR